MSGVKSSPLKYRNEMKFICHLSTLTILSHRLKQIMTPDTNAASDGRYLVTSLYFDDPNDICCFDNDSGISQRSKYRIRMYNRNPNILRFEQKIKRNYRCAKLSCALSFGQYEQLYKGEDMSDILYGSYAPQLRAFALLVQGRCFSPKAVVEYEREAYVDPRGNVRITLDTQCSVSYAVDRFLTGDMPFYPIQDENLHILEVKYDEFLPDHIRQVLQMNTLSQASFSKYHLGRQVLQKYWG